MLECLTKDRHDPGWVWASPAWQLARVGPGQTLAEGQFNSLNGWNFDPEGIGLQEAIWFSNRCQIIAQYLVLANQCAVFFTFIIPIHGEPICKIIAICYTITMVMSACRNSLLQIYTRVPMCLYLTSIKKSTMFKGMENGHKYSRPSGGLFLG